MRFDDSPASISRKLHYRAAIVGEEAPMGAKGLDSREEQWIAEAQGRERCCPAHCTGSIVECGYLTVRSPFIPAA